MPSNDLLTRLHDKEDNFVERKPANPNRQDIRKTVVAFANSVTEGRTGILFVGIRDDGTIEGVSSPEKLQKTIREVCEQDCYPPITFRSEVVNSPVGDVIAVVIPESSNRPHFAGPAYVRRGSESISASPEIFDELVHSRNSKTAVIAKLKGQIVSVQSLQHKLGEVRRISDSAYSQHAECTVVSVDPHRVRLQVVASGGMVSEPLDHVTVNYDEEKWRPLLVITGY